MDKTDRDAWIDYYVSQYEIDCLAIYPESMQLELDEKTLQEYNHWSRMDPSEPKYFDVAGFRATCMVPYTGDPELFKVTPMTHTLRTFEIERLDRPNKDGVGYFVLVYEVTQREATADGIRKHFQEEVGDYVTAAEHIRMDAKQFNDSLRQQVEQAVDKRISELDKFASIRQGLNLPLRRVKDAPMAKPVSLPRKKKLVFNMPRPSEQGESYCIADVDYEHITEIIDSCCSIMEQAPGSYVSFGEEQLRDHILSVLNTHYENATGETFRKKGKTDINVPFEGHAAYIAECKIWHGRKAFLAAIDQLFSYTTWRDTKVSVIVFNKDIKNFETVLDAVQDALDEVSIQEGRPKHSQWYCKIQNKYDERIMHVTVQVFNLHA
ncbi:hypothetical protein [Denitrobacterium detoxificans]|nr:hypothetical protein [Denitrobacterium detoxificans]